MKRHSTCSDWKHWFSEDGPARVSLYTSGEGRRGEWQPFCAVVMTTRRWPITRGWWRLVVGMEERVGFWYLQYLFTFYEFSVLSLRIFLPRVGRQRKFSLKLCWYYYYFVIFELSILSMKPHGDKERTNDRKCDSKNGKNYFSGSTGQWDILKT